MPTANLWPGILAKIDSGSAKAEPHTRLWGQAAARPRRQVTFSLPQLALAASLLIAVSAGVAYVAAGRPRCSRSLSFSAKRRSRRWPSPWALCRPTSRPRTLPTPQFDRAVTDLERMLRRAARRARSADHRHHRAQSCGDRRSHPPSAGGARRRSGQHVPEFAPGRCPPAQARVAAPRDIDCRGLTGSVPRGQVERPEALGPTCETATGVASTPRPTRSKERHRWFGWD